MKIFTIVDEKVTIGARVEKVSRGNFEFPAITVGEEGRGRKLAFIPVKLTSVQYKSWKDKGYAEVYNVSLVKNEKGVTMFKELEKQNNDSNCVVVMKNGIGFRGWNEYTGSLKDEYYEFDMVTVQWEAERLGVAIKDRYSYDEARMISQFLQEKGVVRKGFSDTEGFERKVVYHPFPIKVLAKGVIAQGDAGKMGKGSQIIGVVSPTMVFRVCYGGRLYGKPDQYYYVYDGKTVHSMTEEIYYYYR